MVSQRSKRLTRIGTSADWANSGDCYAQASVHVSGRRTVHPLQQRSTRSTWISPNALPAANLLLSVRTLFFREGFFIWIY